MVAEFVEVGAADFGFEIEIVFAAVEIVLADVNEDGAVGIGNFSRRHVIEHPEVLSMGTPFLEEEGNLI